MRLPTPNLRFAAQNSLAATLTSLSLLSTVPINMPALAASPTAVVQQAAAPPSVQKGAPGSGVGTPFVIGNDLKIPDPRIRGGRIFDGANILDAAAQRQISIEISAIEREVAGSQVVVVTVGDVPASKTPKRVATELFNYWGIGSIDRENGVLVLIVKNARRVEIEVGLALEKDFDNSWCTSMLTAEVVPSFKEAQYGEGVLKGVTQIGERLRGGGGGFEVARTDSNPFGDGDVAETWAECFARAGVTIAFAISYIALGSFATERRELKSRTCTQCGAVLPSDAIGRWVTTINATNVQRGERVRDYTCEACGRKGQFKMSVAKYDYVRYDTTTGEPIYYDAPSSSSSSSGGSSDGGGGGGASW